MAHESFEDEATAKAMNQDFINIKVDREERPDVDKIYMTFTQATTGSGGWPMSVFLTPDLKPFLAGTYFPPRSSYGRPGFKVRKRKREKGKNENEKKKCYFKKQWKTTKQGSFGKNCFNLENKER